MSLTSYFNTLNNKIRISNFLTFSSNCLTKNIFDVAKCLHSFTTAIA